MTPHLHHHWFDVIALIATDEITPNSLAQLECALRGHFDPDPLPIIEW
jgi:hypothetical protein